ncbi:hypothetical protein [Tunicatimonas pelagia]|uniref:hypothetical protein n=1 Tax=Tunicatimonas pelagia TaxID=931531 RepID=UPI0026653D36|nr:hypothetical protein [Tunicatimonas pelagia]WKN44279.1 hypothetical protein P0M28_04785 [Tunicatimonas pelagia]
MSQCASVITHFRWCGRESESALGWGGGLGAKTMTGFGGKGFIDLFGSPLKGGRVTLATVLVGN